MRIPKKYGYSKKQDCPFCGKPATTKSIQDVPVCQDHKQETLDIRCACGSWLEVRSGKWGPYFNCINCGNLSFSKGMGMKALEQKKEIRITTDDVEYFD